MTALFAVITIRRLSRIFEWKLLLPSVSLIAFARPSTFYPLMCSRTQRTSKADGAVVLLFYVAPVQPPLANILRRRMAKHFPPGPCVHCLQHVEKPTSDHVFPKSWYPDSTPENLEKWQIPSCSQCNQEYGRLEERLFIKLALCVDNEAWESLGLGSKLVRALDPSRGRDARDTSFREKQARSLLASMHEPSHERLTLCTTPNASGEVITVEVRDLNRLGEKIMRGLTFIYLGKLVTSNYQLTSNGLPGVYPSFDSKAHCAGEQLERGPGIEVRWAKTAEDPVCGMFVIRIFGCFSIRGVILPKGYKPNNTV